MNKLIIISMILIVFVSSQTIKLSAPDLAPASFLSNLDFYGNSQTQVYSYIYQGIVNVDVSSDQQNNINFYVQLVQDYDCSWVKCFNGWVLNYTQNGENPVIGYDDKTLVQPPIFRFNTNSESDYEIIRSNNLGQIWVQIIELTCQKINPQLITSSSLDSSSQKSRSSNTTSSSLSNQATANGKCIPAPKGISLGSNIDPNCISFIFKNCLKCSKQYYLDSNGKCIPVNPLCSSNDNSGACTSCFQGYSLVSGQCKVLNTDPYCNSIDSNGLCQGCYNGYYYSITQQRCIVADVTCKTFDVKNGNCLSCYPGYTLSNGGCSVFFGDPNCLKYDSNNNCIQCNFRFYLDSSKKCQPVSPLCKTSTPSSGNCQTCYIGYSLSGGQCVLTSNNINTTSSDVNCKTFQNGVCSQCYQGYVYSCNDGYSLVNGNCVISTNDIGCNKWDWDNQVCLGCISNWSLINGVCVNSSSQNSPKYVFTQANINVSSTDKSYNGFIAADPLLSAFNINSSFSLLKPVSSDYQATLSNNLAVDKVVLDKSASNQNILLDSSLMVKQRLLAYDFSFKSDNLTSSQGYSLPNFAGKLAIGLKQSWQGGLISSIYNPIKSSLTDLISSPDSNSSRFNSQDIQNIRTNSGQTLLSNQIKNDPPVVSSNITTINPQDIDVFKLYNGDPSNVAAAKSYLNISTPNTSKPTIQDQIFLPISNAKILSPVTNTVDTAPSTSLNLNNQFSKGRLLQFLTSYEIYNYEKVLLSQNVLNQPMTIKFNLKCDLLLFVQNQTIRCKGLLIYQLLSLTNTQTVFEYSKTISSVWSLSIHLGGSWGFDVWIPFPPPYSFAGIRFIFSIGYSIDITAASTHVLALPYKVIVSAVVNTEVATDSSASVGIKNLVEGGIFIRGTIAKLRTDPKFTISYWWWIVKKINIRVEWYYQILPYTFYWGFQYRTKKLFGGWNSWHTLAQWDINIPYGKFLLMDKNWDICC